MAEMNTIDVTQLDAVEAVESGDTLLLIRDGGDGSKEPCRVEASQFRGEDAYAVARRQGFAGTYDEWLAHVNAVRQAGIAFDAATGEIVIS